MAPTLLHLPNGQTLTVSPVFAGLSFKANDLTTHHSVFPPGWTIIIESEDELDPASCSDDEAASHMPRKRRHIHRYRSPTLHNDNLFISSISNPSNVDFKPATSPTRQIAMMLWATMYWYFHQVWSTEVSSLPLLNSKASPHRILILKAQIPTFQRLAAPRAIGASTSRGRAYSRASSCSQN